MLRYFKGRGGVITYGICTDILKASNSWFIDYTVLAYASHGLTSHWSIIIDSQSFYSSGSDIVLRKTVTGKSDHHVLTYLH